MKKILLFAVVAMLVALACACTASPAPKTEEPVSQTKQETKPFEVVLEKEATPSIDGYDVTFKIVSSGTYPEDTIFVGKLKYMFQGDTESRTWYKGATASVGYPGTFGVIFGKGQDHPTAWVEVYQAMANDAQLTKLALKDDSGKTVEVLSSKPQKLIFK
jgi:hypothetical protein